MPEQSTHKASILKSTRRAFLIGGGAAVGLAIGYAVWPRERALNLKARKGETIVNGWLKIGTDGRVVVLVPQAEMGQGVYTALPQILADELGADWKMVAVEPAPLHPIYANRLLMQGGAEALPSMLQGIGRWAIAEFAEWTALQVTGGSTSVRAFYDTLRQAGAAAREMLCKAAADLWDVDWQDCDTANGMVHYKANRVRFAEIAARAAEQDPPFEPRLREPGKGGILGRSAPRIDIPSKTDGSARFGTDVRLPNMVYAAVRSGPVGATRLTRLDASGLRGRPGIIDTVQGDGWYAVVADTWWGARKGLDAVKASFATDGRLAASGWIDQALRKAAADGEGQAFRDEGDAPGVLSEGSVVRADYFVPFLAHACLEPMTATARVADGRAEIWAPTQSASLAVWGVARALDIDDEAVTVYPTLLGGGFGRKAEADACVQAALIARQVKRPVQLIWTREEDFAQDRFRPAAAARLQAKLDADKRIAAWHGRIAVPSVSNSFMGRTFPSMAGGGDPAPEPSAIEGAADLPYAIPAIRVEHVDVPVPVPLGYWRSVGHSYTAFFVESFVDELAYAAGTDPLTFRLRMMADRPRHAAVLKMAASRGGLLGGASDGGARGIAIHECFGSIVAQVAEVEVDPETGLQVKRVTCVIDCGRVVNPDIVKAQMEGGIIFGLSAALHGAIGFDQGRAVQSNFDSYPLLSMAETPEIEVIIMPSDAPPGGVGEPGVPPIAPAVANALFAATGVRVRDLPFAGKPLVTRAG